MNGIWTVREYWNDGYEMWLTNTTEFDNQKDAEELADKLMEFNSCPQSDIRVEFDRV